MKKSDLLATADICVKCGLCLPQCPTYQLTLDENESPRGRISLIQGWASGQLKLNTNLLRHLDGCLLCRSCENVCPAQVPYSRLVDEARANIGKRRLSLGGFKSGVVNQALRDPSANRLMTTLSKRSHRLLANSKLAKTGVGQFLSAFGGRSADFDTSQSTLRGGYFSGTGDINGTVGLFIGCTGELVDGETIDSAIQVITRLGFDVVIPEQQRCCGALDLHRGASDPAKSLFRVNIEAFADHRFDAIVSFASGCGAMLKEYEVYSEDVEGGQVFSSKVRDISEFIVAHYSSERLPVSPLLGKVYIHIPCSLKNVFRSHHTPGELLQKLPGVELIEQPSGINCCGAAGSYMVEHPEISKSIRKPLLESVIENAPNYVSTSNVGCAIHLRQGLTEPNPECEVLHPVTLLARHLTGSVVS